MASHSTDAGHDPHADDIVLAAAERGLGSRERLRLIAVSLWCAFLGAILALAEVITLLPDSALAAFGLGEASLVFLCSWVLMLIPVTLALALCGPHHGR